MPESTDADSIRCSDPSIPRERMDVSSLTAPLGEDNRQIANDHLDAAKKSLSALTENCRNLSTVTRESVNRAREAISEAETHLANQK